MLIQVVMRGTHHDVLFWAAGHRCSCGARFGGGAGVARAALPVCRAWSAAPAAAQESAGPASAPRMGGLPAPQARWQAWRRGLAAAAAGCMQAVSPQSTAPPHSPAHMPGARPRRGARSRCPTQRSCAPRTERGQQCAQRARSSSATRLRSASLASLHFTWRPYDAELFLSRSCE
jgi:hypothetical protein